MKNYEQEELTLEQYTELKNRIDEIAKNLTSIINDMDTKIEHLANPMIYNYVDNNMPEWAREGVQWCIDHGIITGTGDGLGLDDRDLKYCTMIMRLMKNR